MADNLTGIAASRSRVSLSSDRRHNLGAAFSSSHSFEAPRSGNKAVSYATGDTAALPPDRAGRTWRSKL